MSNYTISIELTRFSGAGTAMLKNQEGKPVKCLVLPIEENSLFQGDRGGIYASFVCWENGKLKDGKTHLVKQSLPRERRQAMTEQQLRDLPVFGSMKPMQAGQPAAQVQEYTAAGEADTFMDDLPF